ncbi:MAG: hypothetical protein JWO63_3059 [Frankiales bacterium]|jgi:GAF domain-containing protein|nr:hypothetical protein [Frankiales bacterium]
MGAAAEFDVAKVFAQVARDIAHHEDLVSTRQHIVSLARSSLNGLGASVWHLKPNDQMTLDAATGEPFLPVIERILAEHPDGPSWQSLHSGQIVVSPNLTVETRWPAYVRALLAETPVRSAVSYPLTSEDSNLGVLSVYSEEPGHFTEPLVQMGAIYAAHAALAMEKAFMQDRATNLQAALASNRRIGMAIGILMNADRLTEGQAFDLLRVASQNLHRKVADVAEDVVLAGVLPTWELRLA